MKDFSKGNTLQNERLPQLKEAGVVPSEAYSDEDSLVAIYRLKLLDCQLSQRHQTLWEIDQCYLSINLQCSQLDQEVELTLENIERLTKSLSVLRQEDNLTTKQQRLLTILEVAPYRVERAGIKVEISKVKKKIAQIARTLPSEKLELTDHDSEASLRLAICQMQARLGEILRNHYIDDVSEANRQEEFHALFEQFAYLVEQLSDYSYRATVNKNS